jgi:iron complex outermembrane receptor protein
MKYVGWVVCLALATGAWAAPATKISAEQLADLSLEELLNVQVTSVSKRRERVGKAASAIFVISREDLRRSGVTSIPEALRMVPGMHVAKIDSGTWAISTRGFNDQFANKLLVLIDGRSVYTPLFAGVYWDVQDVVLEDVERIEVVRGPGATLWGANAVNGVINIITRSARDTQGGLVSGVTGREERAIGVVRHGSQVGKNGYLRVHAKAFERDSGAAFPPGGANDKWHVNRGGFRFDRYPSDAESLMVQGEIYDGTAHHTLSLPLFAAPFRRTFADPEELGGGHLLGRWTRRGARGRETTVQVYYDRVERNSAFFIDQRDTFDLDVQQSMQLSPRQSLLWGFGFRHVSDDLPRTSVISFNPQKRDAPLYSAFVQDDIDLVPERLRLTVGSRFEHNDYSGFEVQPNMRLLYAPDAKRSAWLTLARAVRTPARIEHDIALDIVTFPVPPVLNVGRAVGDPRFEAEVLVAHELGYRVQATKRLSVDVAAFYNDYNGLRTFEPEAQFIDRGFVPPRAIFLQRVTNGADAETAGFELSTVFDATDRWRLTLTGTLFDIHVDATRTRDIVAKGTELTFPAQQVSLRSQWNVTRTLEFDTALYVVDDIQLRGLVAPEYERLDARLGWRPRQDLDLSLVGQNLLDRRHLEFGPGGRVVLPTQVERSVFATFAHRF